MKAFVFINAILRPIQQGIQGGHALLEMATKYRDWKGNKAEADMFWDWAKAHKTVAFCSAGFHGGIQSWYKFVFNNHHGLPRGLFREDNDTLNGLMTAVAIVVPGHLYNVADLLRKKQYTFDSDGTGGWTEFEYELINRLAEARLAS
jgi:hypothetical protein